ncbi:PREDICTED: uncharacterized protein LOC106330269 [Brassica oleracea var. oleracea]|uniref:uncharacterized protein LOC106330269 n=1 Tax=Brassica oleracea var. oleracea TaxID=109376 RepID=UPI0006A74BA3|nr:PREDICTED: uncharacterized protein LOC106330269 [Brassica oleracea var. oleracea]
MVVETRGGGKRKDNPTKEEVRKVKFVKTASDNIEKTTTENVESTGMAKTTEIVDSREKTMDVSTEVTTDVSTEKTTDVSAEKTSEDARESTAEITEPSDVALETAPATVNKGPAGPSPPAPPATPAIGTESEEEENEETPSSGDEENQKAGSGEEENDHDDRSDGSSQENEDAEEEQEEADEKEETEGSEEGNEDEEGKDNENEGFEEENDREELANGDDNENPPEPGNPPEPEGLNGNVATEAIKPTSMFFKPTEYRKKIKLGTRCMIASAIKTLKNLKPKLSNAEMSWFKEHPQFRHIFHMKIETNHRVQGMWMLLLRNAGSEKLREVWFIVNGVPIRYGLREHGLISGLFCQNYPLGYKELGGTRFVDRHFKEGEPRRLEDVKKKLVNMGPHKDRLKMAVLFFLASVVCAQTKVGHKANDVLEVFQRAVDDLEYCKSFPWGRFSYDYMLKEISHTMKHFGGVVKEKTLWPLPGFCVPLELLAFEAIPKLGIAFREPVVGAGRDCPRMCKSYFKRNGMTGVSLSVINKELGNTTVIDSIIPTKTPREDSLLDEIMEDEDDVDQSDIAVDSWEKCLDAGQKVFFKDMFDEDVAGREKQPEPIEDATGDGVQVGEQSIQLGDVMNMLKKPMKLMRKIDKKVD